MSLTPADRVRRGRVRGVAAAVLLMAWSVALIGLVRRDVLRTNDQRLADLAVHISPGSEFFGIDDGGRHIGWASSTIDTLTDTLVVRDALTADIPVGGATQRTVARSDVFMTRAFVLRSFTTETGISTAPTRISGSVEGDSVITCTIETNGRPADTRRIRVQGPVLMPTLIPIATMLGGKPKVGRRVSYQTFDPAALAAKNVTVEIQAESLFVIADSAKMNDTTGRWIVASHDTVRAWRIAATDGPAFGWIDAQGRPVETKRTAGLTLHRMAYELAFENWRLDNAESAREPAKRNPDLLTPSVFATNAKAPTTQLAVLKVGLTAPSLTGFSLRGGRQSVAGNVVTITREDESKLIPAYTLPPTTAHRAQFRTELQDEPGLEVDAPVINAEAVKIAGQQLRQPREIVANLVRWVHDSLTDGRSTASPDAVEALQTRRGECNEHTQLFTAMARKLGIPTRVASGVVYDGRNFHYHAWPEVYLADWVAVDPTFGQFPADASHLRLLTGAFNQQAPMQKLTGTLHIDVLEAR